MRVIVALNERSHRLCHVIRSSRMHKDEHFYGRLAIERAGDRASDRQSDRSTARLIDSRVHMGFQTDLALNIACDVYYV